MKTRTNALAAVTTFALLWASPLLAAPAPGKTPDVFRNYRPVVVTTFGEQTISDELANKILKAFSQTLQRGFMSSLASAQYAAGPSFPKADRTRGPVSGMLKAISEADSFFDVEMQSDLGKALKANPANGRWTMMFEGLLSDDQSDFETTLESQTVPPNLALMWEVAKSTVLESVPVGTAVMVNRAMGMPLVASTDPRVNKLYQAGARIYDGLHRGDLKRQFLPIYLRMLVQVDGPSIALNFQASVKPGDLNVTGPFAQGEPVRPVGVRMDASLAPSGKRPLMQVRMQRRWGAGTTLPHALAIATFGSMVNTDIRDVRICRNDCVANLDYVPVIRLKLQPSVLLPKDKMSSNASTFWPIYWEELKRAYGYDSAIKKLKALVVKMDAYQQKYVTLHIMINQLVIDLKDAGGMTILPQLSSTPVLVQLVSGGGKTPIRDDYLTLSRVADDETRPFVEPWTAAQSADPLRTLLTRYTASKLIELRNRSVFRLYEQTIGPEVAKNLSGEVRNNVASGIREVDQSVAKSIDGLMQPVLNLMR